MAHFAKLDENNLVLDVIVVNNESIDPNNEEESGISFLKSLFGDDTVWKQTSYNRSFRKNFAGVNYTFRDDLNMPEGAFVSPKPFESWVFDEEGCGWLPPVEYPSDGLVYFWDEDTISWKIRN
jgi:hypothetical protein